MLGRFPDAQRDHLGCLPLPLLEGGQLCCDHRAIRGREMPARKVGRHHEGQCLALVTLEVDRGNLDTGLGAASAPMPAIEHPAII